MDFEIRERIRLMRSDRKRVEVSHGSTQRRRGGEREKNVGDEDEGEKEGVREKEEG